MTIAPELLRRIVEGALLAAGQPLNEDKLLSLIDEGERPEKSELRQVLQDIADSGAERGFELRQVASGWRFQVPEDLAPWVNRLWEEKPQKYSRAILETLAIIAYRQPITRGDIEEIRGVAVSSHIVKTLTERGWIKVVGQRDVPGKPSLYATTREFLDYFNLRSLDDLPTLAEIRDIESLNQSLDLGDGTPVKQAGGEPGVEAESAEGEVADSAIEAETAAGEGTATEATEAGVDATDLDGVDPGRVNVEGEESVEADGGADSGNAADPAENDAEPVVVAGENPAGTIDDIVGEDGPDVDVRPASMEDAAAGHGLDENDETVGETVGVDEDAPAVAGSDDTVDEGMPESAGTGIETVADTGTAAAGETSGGAPGADGQSIAASLPASALFGGTVDAEQAEEEPGEGESQETAQPENTNT
ncbi:SMC-Scp complex subunit ScpB [Microbulbifer zhoushanensis]|uniref:SMC-Scp complex subunit ScpB n=1 Tax=Microbulbifer zhoushanensis TaxID=2904254 RepID=UPI001F031BF5|nr:SMC-Scp complex subunit ScpB [Microbulbifer zhoushanensis]